MINNITLDKVLVQNIELEEAILGTILVDYKTTDILLSRLKPEDFYKPIHVEIFKSYIRLFNKGIKIDLITTTQDLKENDVEFDPMLLVNISNKVATSYHIESHIDILLNISIKRKITSLGFELTKQGYDITSSGKENLSTLIKEAELLLSRTTTKNTKDFKEIFIDTIKEIENKQGQPLGIPTGFNELDKLTSGLTEPDLTIIAASPGEGKSVLALNIADNVARNYGDVLFFSLEMKTPQLIYRLLSNETNTSVSDIRLGRFEKDINKFQNLYEARFNIFDKGSMAIDELVSICKYEALKKELKLIVVDYLQLLGLGVYATKGSNRNNDIGIISRKLKELAMDLNIPVIALSQVNRDKNRKEYRLADLRESGSIEQDADNVWFIFRPLLHNMSEYNINDSTLQVAPSTTIIQIGKNRLGKIGQIQLTFNGAYSRFENYHDNLEPPIRYDEPSMKPNIGNTPF